MSQTPGMGSSREDRPPSESTHFRPATAPLGTVVQETVLNPEGRRRSNSDSSHSFVFDADDGTPPDSQIWKRLFPSENEAAFAGDVETAAGCELGHFTIEDRIGSGGMGAVFRALDTRLQRVVALKVLAPAQSRDRSSVLRFQNEARAAARLDHENIARVFFFGEDRGLHFIAFEYVTGQNVRELIARTGRLPVADAVNYALQIAAALRHTAAAGVVHRDIKPSNIIIAPNGRAKLVDLGLARKLAADSVGDLTVAGTTLGTFDYISPEQARDPRSVDVRSDIYSLGCTLYHMLTGGPPYSSGTVLQKLLDHQSGQAPDPRTVNPQVPPALSAVCRKMMAGDPKHRHATPDDLIRELSVIAAGYGLRPLPADSYVWMRPPAAAAPKIRPGVIWAISAAVVVLLAILVDRWPSAIDPEPSAVQPSSVDATSPIGQLPASRSAAISDADSSLDAPPAQPPEPLIPRHLLQETDHPRSISGRAVIPPVAGTPPEESTGVAIAQGSTEAVPESSGVPAPPGPSPAEASSGTAPAEASGSLEQQLAQAQSIGDAVWSVVKPLLAKAEPVEPPPATPTESAESDRYGLTTPFVVWTNNAEPQGYDTFAEAVENAYSGDTIELHFDGRLPGAAPVEPIVIYEKSIAVAAGTAPSGRPYRPLIEFVGDGRLPRSKMIVVSGDGASLTLDGVELRMEVTGEARSTSKQWALFAVSNSEQVRLRRVAITLVNPDAWPLSVFDLRPPEGVSPAAVEIMRMKDASRAEGFRVEMENCFVRGEADLVTIAHTLPGRIEVSDSAFALEMALLDVTGGLDEPPAGDKVDVVLDHVTAVLGAPVLQLAVDDLPRHVTVLHFDVRDSIFSAASDTWFAAGSPGSLVLMTGNASPESFGDALIWTGNRNVFDGFSQFWSIYTEDGPYESAPTTFALWTHRWKKLGRPEDPSIAEHAIPPDDRMTNIWDSPQEARSKSRLEITAGDLAVDTDDLLTTTDEPIGASVDDLPKATNPPEGIRAADRSPRR